MLLNAGVKRGDVVTIYMSRCPEMVIAMLAVARIGAVHSIVFGGFAAHAIVDRVEDADAHTLSPSTATPTTASNSTSRRSSTTRWPACRMSRASSWCAAAAWT